MMWRADTEDGERAPAYALLAAMLHLINSIPTAPNPLTRSFVRMAGLATIALALLSAYHWALEKSGGAGWLTLLAVIAVLVATIAVVVAGVEIGRRLEIEERHQDDHDPEPAQDQRPPDP